MLPVQSSYRVDETVINGSLLRMQVAVHKASPEKLMRWFGGAIIDQTISNYTFFWRNTKNQ